MAVLVVGVLVRIAHAGPSCTDAAAVAAARAAVDAACECAGVASHRDYVRCASDVVRATVLSNACRKAVLRCASRSTCGRPGAVTCCRARSGRSTCRVESSAARCQPSHGGTACVGALVSCCDACTADGCVSPSTCGNGTIEPGEACDPPSAMCSPDCQQAFSLSACCQLGTPPESICVADSPIGQACFSVGGTRYLGRSCAESNDPCPGDPFPGCRLGECVGSTIPPTPLCCQLAGSCFGSTVTTSEGYANHVFSCFLSAGLSNSIGVCGADGLCAPSP